MGRDYVTAYLHMYNYNIVMGVQEAEETAKKQAAEKGKDGKGGKGGKGGGGASKAGKKGKDTPAMDAGLAIPLPEKPATSMRKRGEEDLDSKYIGQYSSSIQVKQN